MMNGAESVFGSPGTRATSCRGFDNAEGGGARRDDLVDVTSSPMLNHDGTDMRDEKGQKVYRSQFLSTHPLKSDCKERVGYVGKKFTYVSGDGVIRTMNQVFGHGGWSSEITRERMVMCEEDKKGRWHVGYLATVRVKLRNGVSHEDCGSGEAIDPSKIKAHEKAMKSAITDSMKRAARHYGERLGNALYVKGSGIRVAPRSNKVAIADLEKTDALNLFGDQTHLRPPPEAYTPGNQSPGSWSVSSRLSNTSNSVAASGQRETLQMQGRADHTPVTSVRAPCPPTAVYASRTQQPYNNQSGIVTPRNLVLPSNVSAPAPAGWNNAPNPPNLLMPPPKPMYNPGGSGTTGLAHAQHNQIAASSSDDVSSLSKRGSCSPQQNGGGEKRLKKNPYSRGVS